MPFVGFDGSACVGTVDFLCISIWHFATTLPQSGKGSTDKAISSRARFTIPGGKMLSVASHVSNWCAVNCAWFLSEQSRVRASPIIGRISTALGSSCGVEGREGICVGLLTDLSCCESL